MSIKIPANVNYVSLNDLLTGWSCSASVLYIRRDVCRFINSPYISEVTFNKGIFLGLIVPFIKVVSRVKP